MLRSTKVLSPGKPSQVAAKEAVEVLVCMWSMWWARHPYIESANAL